MPPGTGPSGLLYLKPKGFTWSFSSLQLSHIQPETNEPPYREGRGEHFGLLLAGEGAVPLFPQVPCWAETSGNSFLIGLGRILVSSPIALLGMGEGRELRVLLLLRTLGEDRDFYKSAISGFLPSSPRWYHYWVTAFCSCSPCSHHPDSSSFMSM